jgi:L-cysteine:1D-myo-inositol 2-amino-2-deoxy-alpha-D-glucopyranoside ligase
MQAWSAPEIPRLPGPGLPVRVFDTASRRLLDSAPGSAARMYVCGITPYDATHIGHAATYVAFDLLHRAWLDAGRAVTYVQNVTDIDDPLLERARATGEDWLALATRETQRFRQDMAALRIIPPTVYVGAIEALPLMIDMIQVLRDRGAAYEVDGDLYFPVSADESFGTVAGLDRTEMLAKFREEGGDPDRVGKKDPLDCLLWQRHRPEEPGWNSPFGFGRPGWHIECTAMALHYLGPAFDVQGGGRDLAFPHHELCAAEGQVATGVRPFARAYVHAGLVGLGGKKMSKSEGNLVFVAKLLDRGIEPAAIRLALLAHHYRSDWHWAEDDLTHAETRLSRWRSAVAGPAGPPAESLLAEVRARLTDDLDAPGAVAAVDRWAAEALAGTGHSVPGAGDLVAATVDALLGVRLILTHS